MLIQTKSFYLKAFNMKQARPRMLANLKIKKCRDFLGRDISGPGQLFFRTESSLIQSRCRSIRNLKS